MVSAQLSAGLLAERATHLLAAACRALTGDRRTVLLPALYCAEVADAITASGCRVRCYDLPVDLAAPYGSLAAGLDEDVAAVLWHHPFGLYQPPPRPPGLPVIEDACFGVRTLATLWQVPQRVPDLIVSSPRKEFGWPAGGLAVGRLAARVAADVPAAGPEINRAWRGLHWDRVVADGVAATGWAQQMLGDLLPGGSRDEPDPALVRTLLPLLSARRDEVIDSLRDHGVPAWCWQRPMPGCSPVSTPGAWWLWERLLFVPLPPPGSPTYDLVLAAPVDRWPADHGLVV